METLILKSDRDSFEKFYIKNMEANKVRTFPYYKNYGEWFRIFEVLWLERLRLPFSSILYGEWKKHIKDAKNVILFDRNYNWDVIKYIHRKNPSCRIIVWYWNPITPKVRIPSLYREICEEWSYNPNDCIRYGFKKNNQFSFIKLKDQTVGSEEYSLYFVGTDKGRSAYLKELGGLFDELKEKVKFLLIKDKTSVGDFDYSKPISYEENLENLRKTKCIAEITQKNQEGLTVRCVEALLMNKKVITNNPSILQYDFYKPSNILLFEPQKTTIEEIKLFLQEPYQSLDPSMIEKYDFNGWLKNFGLV